MKSAKSLQGQLVRACPEHVVVRDSQGTFVLSEPCGSADCESADCREMAAAAERLQAIRKVPDIFGPQVRFGKESEGIERERSADLHVLGTPLKLSCPEAGAWMDVHGFIHVTSESCGRADCVSADCRERALCATGMLGAMREPAIDELLQELGLLDELVEIEESRTGTRG